MYFQGRSALRGKKRSSASLTNGFRSSPSAAWRTRPEAVRRPSSRLFNEAPGGVGPAPAPPAPEPGPTGAGTFEGLADGAGSRPGSSEKPLSDGPVTGGGVLGVTGGADESGDSGSGAPEPRSI